MQTLKIDQDHFEITLSEDELAIICNCLGEPCYGSRLSDFETKIGASKEHVKMILDVLSDLIPCEIYRNS
jgi:hypothetical protein